MNTLGERIKYLRKNHCVKQVELAEATNISRSNISKIEGDILSPTAPSIIALSSFFNVSIDWLLTGHEHLLTIPSNTENDSIDLQTTEENNAYKILGSLDAYEIELIINYRKLGLIEKGKLLGTASTMCTDNEISCTKDTSSTLLLEQGKEASASNSVFNSYTYGKENTLKPKVG